MAKKIFSMTQETFREIWGTFLGSQEGALHDRESLPDDQEGPLQGPEGLLTKKGFPEGEEGLPDHRESLPKAEKVSGGCRTGGSTAHMQSSTL